MVLNLIHCLNPFTALRRCGYELFIVEVSLKSFMGYCAELIETADGMYFEIFAHVFAHSLTASSNFYVADMNCPTMSFKSIARNANAGSVLTCACRKPADGTHGRAAY